MADNQELSFSTFRVLVSAGSSIEIIDQVTSNGFTVKYGEGSYCGKYYDPTTYEGTGKEYKEMRYSTEIKFICDPTEFTEYLKDLLPNQEDFTRFEDRTSN